MAYNLVVKEQAIADTLEAYSYMKINRQVLEIVFCSHCKTDLTRYPLIRDFIVLSMDVRNFGM
jgi:hypothetical protein